MHVLAKYLYIDEQNILIVHLLSILWIVRKLDREKVEWMGDPSLRDSFRNSILHLFENLPSHDPQNRTQDRRLKKLVLQFEQVISQKGEELMDALTDSVKDFPTVQEIDRAEKLLDEIFNKGVGKDLIERLHTAMAKVSPSQKAMVIKERLDMLRSTCSSLLEKIAGMDWSGVEKEESEEFYDISQVMSQSISLIDSMKYSLTLDPNADISLGIASLLYLTLRANAFLLGKIERDSLGYTIAAVQVYLYSNAPFLVPA